MALAPSQVSAHGSYHHLYKNMESSGLEKIILAYSKQSQPKFAFQLLNIKQQLFIRPSFCMPKLYILAGSPRKSDFLEIQCSASYFLTLIGPGAPFFPYSKIEIFSDFLTKFPILKLEASLLDSSDLYTYLNPCKNRIYKTH